VTPLAYRLHGAASVTSLAYRLHGAASVTSLAWSRFCDIACMELLVRYRLCGTAHPGQVTLPQVYVAKKGETLEEIASRVGGHLQRSPPEKAQAATHLKKMKAEAASYLKEMVSINNALGKSVTLHASSALDEGTRVVLVKLGKTTCLWPSFDPPLTHL
jgi:hypothetical protein